MLPRKKNFIKHDFYLKIPAIVFILSLFILFPPFLKNSPMSGHDFGAHMIHLRIFTDALIQGQFPVRWVEWPQAGQNLPLFVYYQPFVYYFAQLPRLTGLSLLSSIYITTLFLWIFSGFSMYLLTKAITKNNLSELISASLYIFLPYHILNIFIRSAFPESAALAFTPLLFYAISSFFNKPTKLNFSLISLSLFLILISHPVSFIIFFSMIFIFFVFVYSFTKNEKKNKVLLHSLLAIILGIGLSAFYIFPAIELQNAVNTQFLTGGIYDYRNHFLCFKQIIISPWGTGNSIPGCHDKLSFQLSLISIIILLTSLVAVIYFVLKRVKTLETRLLGFFLFFAFVGIFFCLPPSKIIWENVSYFSLIQFPWRFLGLTMFCVSILGGLLFNLFKIPKKQIVAILLLILIPFLSIQFLKPGWYLPNDFFAQDSKNFYEVKTIYQQKNIANMGYMPKTVKSLLRPNEIPKNEIKVIAKNVRIEAISNKFDKKIYYLESDSGGSAIIYIHFFPGWKFYIKGQEIKPDYSNDFGLPILNFPPGKLTISAIYSGTEVMHLSDFISLLSFLLLTIVFMPKNTFKKIIKEINIFSN